MPLAKSTRAEPLEEDEQFGLGNDAVSLKVKGPQKLLGLLEGVPSGLVKLNVEFVKEGMQLVDIEGPAAIVVKDIKSLVDEHLENIVVQFCHVFKAFINCYYLISYNVNLYFKNND